MFQKVVKYTPKGAWAKEFFVGGIVFAVICSVVTVGTAVLYQQSFDIALALGFITFEVVAGPTLLLSSYYGC